MMLISKRYTFFKLISLIVLATLVFPASAFAEGTVPDAPPAETPATPDEPAASAELTTPAEQPVSEAPQAEASTEMPAPAETNAISIPLKSSLC